MKQSSLLRRVYSKNTIKRIQNKINMLGPRNKINISTFLTIKLILLIIVFVATLFISSIGYILAPIFTIVFYFSQIMNILINLWQSTEIKEEKSTPLYITKKVE